MSELRVLVSKDENFEEFVFRHIDETMSADQAKAIDHNATQLCARDNRMLCKKIEAKLAGLEH